MKPCPGLEGSPETSSECPESPQKRPPRAQRAPRKDHGKQKDHYESTRSTQKQPPTSNLDTRERHRRPSQIWFQSMGVSSCGAFPVPGENPSSGLRHQAKKNKLGPHHNKRHRSTYSKSEITSFCNFRTSAWTPWDSIKWAWHLNIPLDASTNRLNLSLSLSRCAKKDGVAKLLHPKL